MSKENVFFFKIRRYRRDGGGKGEYLQLRCMQLFLVGPFLMLFIFLKKVDVNAEEFQDKAKFTSFNGQPMRFFWGFQ